MTAPKMSVKTRAKITKDFRIEIDGEAFVKALQRTGLEIPLGAAIFVQVPGGGDWSNTSLDIDEDCPIIVTWTTTEESND